MGRQITTTVVALAVLVTQSFSASRAEKTGPTFATAEDLQALDEILVEGAQNDEAGEKIRDSVAKRKAQLYRENAVFVGCSSNAGSDSGCLYIEKRGAQLHHRFANDNRTVWMSKELKAGRIRRRMDRIEVNCRTKQMTITTSVSYSGQGKVLKSWQGYNLLDAIPGSTGYIWVESICNLPGDIEKCDNVYVMCVAPTPRDEAKRRRPPTGSRVYDPITGEEL